MSGSVHSMCWSYARKTGNMQESLVICKEAAPGTPAHTACAGISSLGSTMEAAMMQLCLPSTDAASTRLRAWIHTPSSALRWASLNICKYQWWAVLGSSRTILKPTQNG